MSVLCGVECVVVAGCLRWAWKRCTHVGSDDSATWPLSTADEFDHIPRICRLILAVYESDLRRPRFPPPGGYRLDPDSVVKRVSYEQTLGHAPPYLIYLDRVRREIVVAVRGLNLGREADYKVLLDNRLGSQMFDGGFVHRGLLKSAVWLLNQESETLKRLWAETGRGYRVVLAGHSLGAGVAALLAIIAVNHRSELGGIPRGSFRCYAVAPARCMSLNLAVKYADVIHSVVLQDDFLPRTSTPLEDIFKSIFCLPCLLLLVCLRDTFIPEKRKLADPRRLYVPGRIYHIVNRKFCRCGRFPPEVRTAIPVDERFEHVVLSCHATSDHGIIWIEKESEKALQSLLKKDMTSETVTTAPKVQRLERLQSIVQEHKQALERAVSLNIPHAVASTEEEPLVHRDEGCSEHEDVESPPQNQSEESFPMPTSETMKWDELVEKLCTNKEYGSLERVC